MHMMVPPLNCIINLPSRSILKVVQDLQIFAYCIQFTNITVLTILDYRLLHLPILIQWYRCLCRYLIYALINTLDCHIVETYGLYNMNLV